MLIPAARSKASELVEITEIVKIVDGGATERTVTGRSVRDPLDRLTPLPTPQVPGGTKQCTSTPAQEMRRGHCTTNQIVFGTHAAPGFFRYAQCTDIQLLKKLCTSGDLSVSKSNPTTYRLSGDATKPGVKDTFNSEILDFKLNNLSLLFLGKPCEVD